MLNGIALFLKTRVFNISWESEKREIKTFLNSKRYEDLMQIVIKFLLPVWLFFLQAVSIPPPFPFSSEGSLLFH